jgi:hypothetical protein
MDRDANEEDEECQALYTLFNLQFVLDIFWGPTMLAQASDFGKSDELHELVELG